MCVRQYGEAERFDLLGVSFGYTAKTEKAIGAGREHARDQGSCPNLG
jgi:hypothetical protein